MNSFFTTHRSVQHFAKPVRLQGSTGTSGPTTYAARQRSPCSNTPTMCATCKPCLDTATSQSTLWYLDHDLRPVKRATLEIIKRPA